MKNIYIIPTDKPSRLGYLTKKGKEVFKDLRLFDKPMPNILDSENQHIHITNDEEIKEGDWIYGLFNGGVIIKSEFDVPKNSQYYKEYGLKIILTTNQSLDGVQAIDDEFLEWFVKNPSCEEVIIEEFLQASLKYPKGSYKYKIIIQKEEPKQSIEEYEQQGLEKYSYELKQEITLEEAAILNCQSITHPYCDREILMFIKGVKWQQEQDRNKYSEEDMKHAFFSGCQSERQIKPRVKCWEEFIEQFKKK